MTCERCRDLGSLMTPDGRAAIACGCRWPRPPHEVAAISRIPERYLGCDLERFRAGTPTQAAARDAAVRFAASYPKVPAGLLFAGPTGTGKTHLAVAILAAVVAVGSRGTFVNGTELCDRLQATYSARWTGESADEVIAPYRNCDLLVFDELGGRRPTDYVRDVLYGLINYRYNRMLPIVATTNFLGSDLETRIGSPVRSRLAEMCQQVTVFGPDHRRGKGKGVACQTMMTLG